MSDTEYGHLQVTRHLGIGLKVDTAPQRTKCAIDALTGQPTYLRVDNGHIVIADQVVYQITGYDPADYTLTLELVKDYRPGQKDDPNAETPS
ncbi:hypothetical protein ACFW2V_02570 [Streptomyces sp. NPDC058947]|uniref:hypothetical protein n=1 Tax=Streptomyces sp. NPDC058947 TaxID=3346675 RepID=UPI0036AB6B98